MMTEYLDRILAVWTKDKNIGDYSENEGIYVVVLAVIAVTTIANLTYM